MRRPRRSLVPAVMLNMLFIFACVAPRPDPPVHQPGPSISQREHPVAKPSLPRPEIPVVLEIPSPALLPGTRAEMNTPGYWIGRHPDPDREILSAAQIAALNARSMAMIPDMQDLTAYPESIDGKALRADIAWNFRAVKAEGYAWENGVQPAAFWWHALQANLNLDAIPPRITPGSGFITEYCNQRLLPHVRGVFRNVSSRYIDRLQFNALDTGTPVAILHQSRDGRWLYVAAPSSRAWVPAGKVARCGRDVLRAFTTTATFAVIVAAKADIFTDKELRVYQGRAQMGARFKAEDAGDAQVLRIFIPVRAGDGTCGWQAAYVQKSQAHLGYLHYTPRTIINQAFQLLHAPYGWGGSFGEQDCSRFLQEVFATAGVMLPRNSGQQARIGRLLYQGRAPGREEEKLRIIRQQALAGLTLLRLDGHIMLYLGQVEDEPYAMHATWGYKTGPQTTCVVNRVVVSRLDLGQGPQGSLLARINTIRVLDAPPPGP